MLFSITKKSMLAVAQTNEIIKIFANGMLLAINNLLKFRLDEGEKLES